MQSKTILKRCFMAVASFSTSSKFIVMLAGTDWWELVSLCEVSCFTPHTDADVSTMLALRSHQRVNHSSLLVLHMGGLRETLVKILQCSNFFFFPKLWWKPHLTHPFHPISVNQPHLSTELINQAQLVWLAVPLWVLEMPVISTGKKKHWILLNTHHFCQLTWSQHHHDDLARGA